MKCDEIQDLLHGYVDGELDLVPSLEIEQHLQGCPACAAAVHRHRELRSALNDPGLYHRAPAALAERVRASLPSAARPRTTVPLLRWRSLAVAAASVAAAVLLGWAVVTVATRPSAETLLAEQVVSGHVRSLMANKPVDKEDSNQHKVKPWFNGKVDVAPPVTDFTAKGFTLEGGRLDYVNRKKVGAVVYKRRDHVINLFVWSAPPGTEEGTRTLTLQGFHLIHWTKGGSTFWVISDLNETELQEFVRLIQEQLKGQ